MSVRASDAVEERASQSMADKIRSNLNTTDLGPIMARYHEAVSWRDQ